MKPEASILVVDDHPANLSLLFHALRQVGYTVRVANSGELALTSVRRIQPDLILLDVMMPGLDGFATCRQLKDDPATSAVPVIFLTARTTVGDEVQGLRAGAVDYLTKPVQIEVALARIQTHLTLRRLQQALEQQNRDLDAYARSVAHDLKNPITAMVGAAQMITMFHKREDWQPIDEMAQMIIRSGKAITITINELLAMAGVREGQVTVQPLAMDTIVTAACERLSHLISEYQAIIHRPETWPVACGHGPWIELVWSNYLSNGLKYGGRPPVLTLGATPQDDGMVRFWVHDNGPGLSEAEREQLFREWQRLHQGSEEGHGLGLALVQRIVERLGGTVGIDEADPGSTFYFTLPGMRASSGLS
ncbi:MAG: response regulator [Oscillochloridaceae bacterium umkhey_bin13]